MEQKNSLTLVISAIVIAGAIAAIAWYYHGLQGGNPTPPLSSQPRGGAPGAAQDLGSNIYTQGKNPVQGKLPATVSPVTNPMEGVYKNPFK